MTFVTIKYGENKRLLFNPNCQTRLFLENIRKRCECPNEMELELSDEFGNLKNITSQPSKYANQILNVDRESLVLIHVKRNNSDVTSTTSLENDDVIYIPLLNNGDIVNTKFKARLSNRDPDSARPESKTKRSRDKREKANRRNTEMTSGDRRDDYLTSPVLRRNGSSRTKGQNRSKARKSK